MSPYYLIDLALLLIIGYGTYYYYTKRLYLQLFEYFKIFAIITISAKIAPFTGKFLQKISVISTDTYSISLLIGFGVNFAILYFGYKQIFKLLNHLINSNKVRTYTAKIVTFLEVVIITTFLLFMSMQLKPAKMFLYPSFQKTILYPKIKAFYVSFLNEKFIHAILTNDSTMSSQEIIFKSLKESIK